ncbi:AraC family transcriptional regulator [Alkalimonas collagenimarina]|uniref:AraC family transcriptional regulator n=1 Tax=Alkalimonas collagenimarina TaxID=400390 RepID=A0ABT9GVK0_9GAMM|nr:AraC family transcriptional regulator [Alkalimonas collagenimarina]MDP4534745.1 AraC family transcriptional regulator [Alkalimonas collagenimarina]
MTDERERLRLHMLQPLQAAIQSTGFNDTAIPGVRLYRSDGPTAAAPTIYEPTLCLLVQGSKQVWLGNERLQYHELQYLLAPVTLPVSGKVITASPEKPYLALSVSLDLRELTDLVIDLAAKVPQPTTPARGIAMGDADLELVSVFHRLVQLMQSPEDIPVLLPLLKREMLYRLLLGPVGSQLREFTLIDSQAHRISKVIDILHQRFHQPLRIKDLADAAHLSESSLFQSFKAVTSMSPLQFQKQLRLNEARRIMLYEGLEAATASYKVGYESPSQFSREYSRLFGAPPQADIRRLRSPLTT